MSLHLIKLRCKEIGECWEWATPLTSEATRRYPSMRLNGKVINPRRVAYEFYRGRLLKPEEKLTPICDNPYCLNPEHMKVQSLTQALQRAGRLGKLSAVSAKKLAVARQRAKLDLQAAREIRLSDESGPVLAARYGVDKSMISAVRLGKCWIDYTNPFAGLM